jgi:hypothetical protein
MLFILILFVRVVSSAVAAQVEVARDELPEAATSAPAPQVTLAAAKSCTRYVSPAAAAIHSAAAYTKLVTRNTLQAADAAAARELELAAAAMQGAAAEAAQEKCQLAGLASMQRCVSPCCARGESEHVSGMGSISNRNRSSSC